MKVVESTERVSNQLKDFFWRIYPLKDCVGVAYSGLH